MKKRDCELVGYDRKSECRWRRGNLGAYSETELFDPSGGLTCTADEDLCGDRFVVS